MELLPYGVHFNITDEAYFSDPALSCSGIKDILISPLTYWYKHNGQAEQPEDTAAKRFGHALHAYLLEREFFTSRYAQEFILPEGALRTVDDMKAWLSTNALPVSGSKPALIERIKTADPSVKFADELKEEYYAEVVGNRTVLTAEELKRVEQAADIVGRVPCIKEIFSGGYPEVAIIWQCPHTGIRMKCRLDYLTPDYIGDLKTYANSRDAAIDRCIFMAIANHGYLLQAFMYCLGLQTVAEMVAGGRAKVFGTPEQEKLFASVIKGRHDRFIFAFVESSAPYNCLPVEVLMREDKLYYQKGMSMYAEGVSIYRQCLHKFGPDRPWVESRGMRVLDDIDLPSWYILN